MTPGPAIPNLLRVLNISLSSIGNAPVEVPLSGESRDFPELAEVGCDGPLHGKARCYPTLTSLLVKVELGGKLRLDCGRCLEKITEEFAVTAKLLVEKSDRTGIEWLDEEEQGVEEYSLTIGPDVVEIPLLRVFTEQILLNYNPHPLPALDLDNKCTLCGRLSQAGDEDKSHRIDPRWAKLRGLRPDPDKK